jgi:hypothetical protein
MDNRIQIVAIFASAALLLVIFEMVRRKRLLERYALLWLLAGAVLLGLAIWRDLLEDIARTIGIAYPPNALFFIAFAFVLALLLHFSLAVSRLSDQSRVLAQRLALLEDRLSAVVARDRDELAEHAEAHGETHNGDADERAEPSSAGARR